VGGGSNFAGLAFPLIRDGKAKGRKTRFVAVEPAACPTMTRGVYAYDLGDTCGLAPAVKMHTLGHSFVPPGIHAGGLRYHGVSPTVSVLINEGVVEPVAYPQTKVFQAALQFTRAEGIVPAPESAHAIRAAIDEALRCKEQGAKKTIVFNLSGHGHFDMGAYSDFMSGKLEDYEYPARKVEEALAELPSFSGPGAGA
jgi:tryptophan synthase beta chain